MILKQAFAPLVDLIYPPRCPTCGDATGDQGGLCLECWSQLSVPSDPSCAACSRPLRSAAVEQGALCAVCLAVPPKHDGLSAGTIYNDASRDLVLSFKHGRKIALAGLLARLMIARLPKLEGEWLVIPVPLHRRRLWQRGFNQSALLARKIAKARGHTLLVDALVRKKATPMLGGLSGSERARVLSGAIEAHSGRESALAGAQILLVDDVMTSGATTNACIKALRKAGASKVRITCFARVMDDAL